MFLQQKSINDHYLTEQVRDLCCMLDSAGYNLTWVESEIPVFTKSSEGGRTDRHFITDHGGQKVIHGMIIRGYELHFDEAEGPYWVKDKKRYCAIPIC